MALRRGLHTSTAAPAASTIVRFLVARSCFHAVTVSGGRRRVSIPGAIDSTRAQNNPARVREIASMLAKSSEACRSRR